MAGRVANIFFTYYFNYCLLSKYLSNCGLTLSAVGYDISGFPLILRYNNMYGIIQVIPVVDEFDGLINLLISSLFTLCITESLYSYHIFPLLI